MNYFLDPITKHYTDFAGRATRKEYWMYYLFYAILVIVIDCISLFGHSISIIGSILSIVISLGLLLPSIAIGVRRLHDIGKSGWWMFIPIVPIVGAIIILIYLVRDSEPGTNKYGPNPKETAPIASVPTATMPVESVPVASVVTPEVVVPETTPVPENTTPVV